MKSISYLSRRRDMMLRLSFLGIIVSFAFCSNRLDGLTIKNGLSKGEKENKITIMKVVENFSELEPFCFVSIPEVGIGILPGNTTELENIVKPCNMLYSSNIYTLARNSLFLNLSIEVEYEGKVYIFETGPLKQNVSNRLKRNRLRVLIKKPTNRKKIGGYYFNSNGKLNELNARFDQGVKFR